MDIAFNIEIGSLFDSFFFLFIYLFLKIWRANNFFFYKEKMNLKLFFPFYYYLFLKGMNLKLFFWEWINLKLESTKIGPERERERISGQTIYIVASLESVGKPYILLHLSDSLFHFRARAVYAMVVSLSFFIFKEILSPNPTSAP